MKFANWRKPFRFRVGLIAVFLSLSLVASTSDVASANDSTGFNFGTDGSGPAPTSGDIPNPCSGIYGFYAGRVNTANDSYMHVSYGNAAQSNANSGSGNGVFAYGDLEGPNNAPGFTGTAAQATSYGETQATAFGENYDSDIVNYGLDAPSFPIVFADMESGNPGWFTSSNNGGYSNWQTLNRDVFNGFVSQIETMDLPNTSIEMLAGIYANPEFYDDSMPSQSITSDALWDADWYYTSGTNPSSCAFSNWTLTSPNYTPTGIFGQTTSSACFEFWQWASTDSSLKDWDQTDHAKIDTTNCPG